MKLKIIQLRNTVKKMISINYTQIPVNEKKPSDKTGGFFI